jgi:hypothetical protein
MTTGISRSVHAWYLHVEVPGRVLRQSALGSDQDHPVAVGQLTRADPRPRMTAALTMAAVRISLDDWIAHGGSLPALTHRALRSITISDPPPPDTPAAPQ